MKRFLKNDEGSIAVMCAAMMLPICILGGMAIDYVRATKVEAHLQVALDGAVMAYAANNRSDPTPRYQQAMTMLTTNIPDQIEPYIGNITLKVENNKITGAINAEVPTTMLRVAQIDILHVNAQAQVVIPSFDLEAVLVLDVSKSMEDNDKYKSMQKAANAMIHKLGANSPEIGTFKVGMVPFSTYVHAAIPAEHTFHNANGATWTGCIESRGYPNNIQTSRPTANKDTQWGLHSDDETDARQKTARCLEHEATNATISDLTTNYESIIDQINGLKPLWLTNIQLGLVWGWHVLTPEAPFETASPAGTQNTVQAIILMSDGGQTVATQSSGSKSVTSARINIREMCKRINDDDLRLFIVLYDVNDASHERLMKNCVASQDRFFEADDAQDLSNAFLDIAAMLRQPAYLGR